jgi:hypothetical protein
MLNQDFKEFIQLLNDNQVRYLVVGGYAVALQDYPRYLNPGISPGYIPDHHNSILESGCQ